MTTRNMVARLEKLEAGRSRSDGALLLWYRPGGDSDAVIMAAQKSSLFASDELVLCAEWLGDDEPPAPRRCQNFPAGLSDAELEYCLAMLRKQARKCPPDEADSPKPYLTEIPDEKLWHMALGVIASPAARAGRKAASPKATA